MNVSSKYRNADLLQLVVARHFEAELGASVVSIGNAPRWDVRFENGITLEIKLDAMFITTSKVAVEYWNLRRNSPSGILSTQATLWIHCLPEGDALRCYEIDVMRLRRAVIETGELKRGGDYNASLMKVLPIKQIREIASSEFVLHDEIIEFFRYW
jgi:hypothetical protein